MSRPSRSIALLLAIVVITSMVVSACSTTPASSTASTPTVAASSSPAGILTFATTDSIVQLFDPIAAGDAAGYYNYGSAVWDSLVELGSDGRPKPAIAERWEISPDGKTHTFFIRKGVKFHNGDDLTAADVKFSLERFMRPDSKHSQAAVMKAAIASIELKDDYTVVLQLKQASGDVLPSIFAFSGAGAVMPKKYIEEKGVDYFRNNPIGSGPWKVVKYQQGGTEVQLEAVEGHWRATPKFKTVRILAVPEESTRLAMLKTGDVDMAIIQSDSAAQIKAAGLSVLSYDVGYQGVIAVHYDVDNPQTYPVGDVRVRKALSLAINRKDMADKLYAGYATPSVLHRVPRTGGWYDPAVIQVTPFDPEQAKKLLSDAGYPNGFNIKQYFGTKENQNYPAAIDGYWRGIGVKSELAALDQTLIISMHQPKPKPELMGNTWTYTTAGLAGWAGLSVFSSTGIHKNTKNSRLDELINTAPGVTDAALRQKMQQEVSTIIKNEYAVIETEDLLRVVAYGKRLGEWAPTVGVDSWGIDLERVPHAK